MLVLPLHDNKGFFLALHGHHSQRAYHFANDSLAERSTLLEKIQQLLPKS
jgi:hypothetical protein